MTLKELFAKAQAKAQRLKEILAKSEEEVTTEELTEAETLDRELAELDTEIAKAKKLEESRKSNEQRLERLNRPANPAVHPDASKGAGDADDEDEDDEKNLPAHQRNFTKNIQVRPLEKAIRLHNFKGDGAHERALAFGMFLGALAGHPGARKFCEKHGIAVLKAQTEGQNEKGGYLVPDQFIADIIILKDRYGVFRREAMRLPMVRDTVQTPRLRDDIETYFAGEASSLTASDPSIDSVGLTARKLTALTQVSSELLEDAAISVADLAIGSIARSMAKREDRCGFIGDGTAAYGNIVGLFTKLLSLYGTTGGNGLVLGSGNLWSELTLGDHEKMLGLVGDYADSEDADGNGELAWYCHRRYYYNVMIRLMEASGGVTAGEIANGRNRRTFMGHRVVFVQVAPKAEANSQIPVAVGNLRMSSTFGDRREMQIALSEHRYFDQDLIAIRAIERFDINNHDLGDADNDSPVVGLVTAAG